jgi:hypothetical protein
MKTVTLDTSVFPRKHQRQEYDELIAQGRRRGFSFGVVFLTKREAYDSSFQEYMAGLDTIFTSGLVGPDAIVGEFVFASDDFAARFEEILSRITNGSFPKDRSSLTKTERGQLRDALIFEAHVREKRDIFISKDRKAFINHGRRDCLQTASRPGSLRQTSSGSLCSSFQ